MLVLHRQEGNCYLKPRLVWPVLPERTGRGGGSLTDHSHLYRLLWKDKSCPAFT